MLIKSSVAKFSILPSASVFPVYQISKKPYVMPKFCLDSDPYTLDNHHGNRPTSKTKWKKPDRMTQFRDTSEGGTNSLKVVGRASIQYFWQVVVAFRKRAFLPVIEL